MVHHAWLLSVVLAVPALAQAPPLTRPERTEWRETSTNADVTTFLDALGALPSADQPGGRRLQRTVFGTTTQGRPLEAVHVIRDADGPSAPPLRALIIANIHGGEVEGKEAVQILLRELLLGEHAALAAGIELVFVPVFNADGNDEIDVANRVSQNGPDGGVGRRHNTQDLDLNRDFVKVAAPETRALLRLFAAVDPHLFMDLHTTNGSHHGYHLTYSPSLCPNVAPPLTSFMHDEFIPGVRARMLDHHGLRIFDYGNFERGERQGGWYTFSSEPRLVFNYAGLRHCVSVLSEAYSYLPFRQRIEVTRAFVLECLGELLARRPQVEKLKADAIQSALARSVPFRFDTTFAPPVDGEILVGSVTRQTVAGLGTRLVANPEFEALPTKIAVRFAARRELAIPIAWAIDGDWPLVAQVLLTHGIEVFRLREPLAITGEELRVESLSRQRAAFQGRRLEKLDGTLREVARELPAGSLVVPGSQSLSRLAAALLEGQSDDGLATWGFFDAAIGRAADKGDDQLCYPVLRLATLPPSDALARVPEDPGAFPSGVPYTPLPPGLVEFVNLRIELVAPGTSKPGRGFESEPTIEGRALRWQLDAARFDSLAELEVVLASVPARLGAKGALVVRPGAGVRHREILDSVEAAQRHGIARVHLAR